MRMPDQARYIRYSDTGIGSSTKSRRTDIYSVRSMIYRCNPNIRVSCRR
jgi:hypothetical protein